MIEDSALPKKSALDIEEQEARISKLVREAEYLDTQKRFYPFVVLSGTAAAIIAFLKFFF
ncbi:MAG: hypothetical protein AAFO61_07030 [Pseudomonadota bacterium]